MYETHVVRRGEPGGDLSRDPQSCPRLKRTSTQTLRKRRTGEQLARVRWLRAGKRDGLHRNEIALDAVDHGKETAFLLRVRPGFELAVVRTKAGANLAPRVFASR